MAGISQITRMWSDNPSIVSIVCSDTLQTISTAGYIASQAANIAAVQNGVFQWQANDVALVAYNGGEGFFNYDSVSGALVPQGVVSTQVVVTSAQILGMYATPVLIIPAPKATQLIIVGRITGTLVFNSAQYAAGGALGLEWGNVAHGAGPAASTTLAAATLNGYAASNNFELTPDNTDTLANTIGLGVYLSNATGAFTTGDSKLLLNVSYQVVNAA